MTMDVDMDAAVSVEDEEATPPAQKKRKVETPEGKPAAKPVTAEVAKPVTAKDPAKNLEDDSKLARKREAEWDEAHQKKIDELRATDHVFAPEQLLYTYSVGQGDSALYINPSAKLAILIDAGTAGKPGASDNAETIGLQIEGIPLEIKHLWVIVTHADSDHWNWLGTLAPSIYQRFGDDVTCLAHEITDVAAREKKNEAPKGYSTWLKTVEEKKWTHTNTSNPPGITKINWKDAKSKNNMSYVTLIPLGADMAYLNMGDAEKEAEEALESDMKGQIGDTTQYSTLLLKAGHHGSITSSSDVLRELVKKHIKPKGSLVVLVSVGSASQFRHPAPETLANWGNLGGKDFRVDLYLTHKTQTITTKVTTGLLQVIPKVTDGVGDAKDFHILECAAKKPAPDLVTLPLERIWVQEAATTGNALYEAVAIALGKPASHVQELRELAGEWYRNHVHNKKETKKDPETGKETEESFLRNVTNYPGALPAEADAVAWFKTSGNWSGELGDLAPWVLANAIGREIVIAAEQATYRIIPASPAPPAITIYYADKTYTANPRDPHKEHDKRKEWPGYFTTKDDAFVDVKPALELGVKRSPEELDKHEKKIAEDKAKKTADAKKPAT